MKSKEPDELLCTSCGAYHVLEIQDIMEAYNNGTFNATVVFEWKCRQCKKINHFACYGRYVKVD